MSNWTVVVQDGNTYSIDVNDGSEVETVETVTTQTVVVQDEGLQGPQGEQGEQGEQGPQGDQGETGPAGADGDTLLDANSRSSPSSISSGGAIPVTSTPSLRIFIVGNGGAVLNPTIAHVSGNKRIVLFGTSDTNTVSIAKSTSNFELSGQWIARNGSRMEVEWDGVSKYTEVMRNEI